jgi:hypothetical protein
MPFIGGPTAEPIGAAITATRIVLPPTTGSIRLTKVTGIAPCPGGSDPQDLEEKWASLHACRVSSWKLGASLKDHVKRTRCRLSNPRKSTVANDLGEPGLTRLRTQAFAYFLIQ